MGISCGKGKMTVTDNDTIEVSNLNRQFLFNKHNLGDYKSKIACSKAKIFNPHLNYKDFQLIVEKETENTFDEKFWISQDLIIFAVDNDEARNYIDTQCVNNKLVGIDAGTLGTKGRVTLIIPDKTISLKERKRKEQKDLQIPMCTLHNFPNTIIHCIEFAKIKFLELTNERIYTMKKFFFKEENDSKEDSNTFTQEEINSIYDYLNLIDKNNMSELLMFCIKLFIKFFNNDINKILELYPLNSLNKDGTLFWSGSKRVPHPINFDINNKLCIMFITNFAILFSKLFDIRINETEINNIINNIDINKLNEEIKINVQKEKIVLNDNIREKIKNIKPLEFNKENDLQTLVIHAFSNLRAINYDIENSSYIETKLILGKIVPSIPTSTSTIGGFVSIQILNLIQTHDLTILRNTLFNLGTYFISQLKPQAVIYHKDNEIDPILKKSVRHIPDKWTIWDKIEINGSKTCNEFIELIAKEYEVIITLIIVNNIIIYDSNSKKSKLNIDKKIEDIYNIKSEKKANNILWFKIIGKLNDKKVFMPKFKYIFQ